MQQLHRRVINYLRRCVPQWVNLSTEVTHVLLHDPWVKQEWHRLCLIIIGGPVYIWYVLFHEWSQDSSLTESWNLCPYPKNMDVSSSRFLTLVFPYTILVAQWIRCLATYWKMSSNPIPAKLTLLDPWAKPESLTVDEMKCKLLPSFQLSSTW